VAQSGDRKSAVDGLATSAIQMHQRLLVAQYDQDLKKYRSEKRRAVAQDLRAIIDPAASILAPRPEWLGAELWSAVQGRMINGLARLRSEPLQPGIHRARYPSPPIRERSR
jgi:hypothetical protein